MFQLINVLIEGHGASLVHTFVDEHVEMTFAVGGATEENAGL